MHRDNVRHSGPFILLSQVSSTVQSLQTPCQWAPQAWGQAAWRQGPEAPVHTTLDQWAAGTRPWGWLLPRGESRGRLTQRQTGRDNLMSRILNSLTVTCQTFFRSSSFLCCVLMWTRKIPHYSVHRKCIMSCRLWAEFMFGHLCSALASVSCWGLIPDTRSWLGLFSFRDPTEGAGEKCFDRKWEWTTNELIWRNCRGDF